MSVPSQPSTVIHVDPVTHVDDVLGRVTDDLAGEFAGTFTRETISRFVDECQGMVISLLMPPLDPDEPPSPRAVTRVGGLTRRFAQERLEAMVQSDGPRPKPVPEVLVVCVHDGGRSQLAAALMTSLGAGQVHVRSAGSAPAPAIHPAVLEVLDEVGLDVAGASPKPLTDEAVRAADVIVTLGCGDTCPIYEGKRYEDWDVGDPSQGLDLARAVRDDLAARVRELIASMDLG